MTTRPCFGSKTYWPGVYNYQFKTCGLNMGNHYLYAVLTDNVGNVTSHYADAPITIKAATDNCSTSIPSINFLLLH